MILSHVAARIGCGLSVTSRILGVAWILAIGLEPEVRAGEPRDALRVAAEIDRLIESRLSEEGHSPVPVTDDAEFLRRASLDLCGRVPTVTDSLEFLDDSAPDRRPRLLDRLLASERFGEQLGRVWRDWIAPAELPSEGNGGNQPIEATRHLGAWFAAQFNASRAWNEIVRSIVEVDGTLKDAPQGLFFSLTGTDTGIPEPAGATRAVTSLFLGVDVQCAQCHDDPYREWKQTDFWGTAAYFRNVEGTFDGRYFASVTEAFGPKPAKNAKRTTTGDGAPNGAITIPKDSFQRVGDVVSASFVGTASGLEAKEGQPLRPLFSEWLVSRENPLFARAFVNRMWSYLFSRGLVEPIDDMRPENPASHPEVLELLSREFVESDFDVKHLLRCLVNTRAYQRSSLAAEESGPALANGFGRRRVKLLSADQLYDSLRVALAEPNLDLRTYDAKEASRFGESSPVLDAYGEFVRLFETDENDATTFTFGIPQFLALLNHPRVSDGGARARDLVKADVAPQVAIETLYLSTLSRRPSDVETREALEFVEDSASPREGYAGVLWMLLNRSEFVLLR